MWACAEAGARNRHASECRSGHERTIGGEEASGRIDERKCGRLGRPGRVAYLQHSHWLSVVKEWHGCDGGTTRRQMQSVQFGERLGARRFFLLQESADAPLRVWETNQWKYQLSCFWAAHLSTEDDADGAILCAYQKALMAERGFGVQVDPIRRGVAVTEPDADVLELIHFFQTH